MKAMRGAVWGLMAALLIAGGALVVSAGPLRLGWPNSGEGTWSNAAGMALYRSEHAASVLNGRIYVAGGLAGPDNNFAGVTSSFASYDPVADSWREEELVPEELHHMGIAALDGRIYITGGYTDSDFTVDNKKVYVFNPEAPAGSRWT